MVFTQILFNLHYLCVSVILLVVVWEINASYFPYSTVIYSACEGKSLRRRLAICMHTARRTFTEWNLFHLNRLRENWKC